MTACELDDRFIIGLLVHYSFYRIMFLEKCSKRPLCSGFVVIFLFKRHLNDSVYTFMTILNTQNQNNAGMVSVSPPGFEPITLCVCGGNDSGDLLGRH